MKMRTFLILTVLFLLGSLATCRVSGSRWPERVDVSFAVSMTVLAVGGAIACASAFALLQRGLAGQPLDSNLTLVIALLGGLLLFQFTGASPSPSASSPAPPSSPAGSVTGRIDRRLLYRRQQREQRGK
ncbi:MAG: hypothetical protein U1F98_06030 [Verrucomicrobiota bacterium]